MVFTDEKELVRIWNVYIWHKEYNTVGWGKGAELSLKFICSPFLG